MGHPLHIFYRIDTGDIFVRIAEKWNELQYKDFVRKNLDNIYVKLLSDRNIFLEGRPKDDFDLNKLHEKYQIHNERLKSSKNSFPFPDFYPYYRKNKVDRIIDYTQNCELTPDDPEYLLFFALKFSLIDILETVKFLRYHLIASFTKDKKKYGKFLVQLIRKYDVLLDAKRIADLKSAEEYLAREQSSLVNDRQVIEEVDSTTKDKNKLLPARVLALQYMLEKLGVDEANIDRSTRARFIQLVTGSEMDAKAIHGTNVYKHLSKRFNPKHKSEKAMISHLQLLRKHFQDLDLPGIVDLIDKDLRNGKN